MNRKLKRRMTPKVFVSELGPVIEKLVNHQDFSVLSKKEQKILERFNNRFQKKAIKVSNTDIVSDWVNVGDTILYLYLKREGETIIKQFRGNTSTAVSAISLYKVKGVSEGSQMIHMSPVKLLREQPKSVRGFRQVMQEYTFAEVNYNPHSYHHKLYTKGYNEKALVFTHRWYRIPKRKYPGKEKMNRIIELLQCEKKDVALALAFLESCSEPLMHNNFDTEWEELFYQLPKPLKR